MAKQQTSKQPLNVYLETSTVLPLLYITPYTQPIIEQINELNNNYNCTFYIQSDCLREIRGQFLDTWNSDENKWGDDPCFRASKILSSGHSSLDNPTTTADLFALLIGGHIRFGGIYSPNYTNHNRFQAFFYADLVGIDAVEQTLREALEIFILKVNGRRGHYYKVLDDSIYTSETAITCDTFSINTHDIVNGWGSYYKTDDLVLSLKVFNDSFINEDNINVNSIDVNAPCQNIRIYNNSMIWTEGLRDRFHYISALIHNYNKGNNVSKMILGDKRFDSHCKNISLLSNGTPILNSVEIDIIESRVFYDKGYTIIQSNNGNYNISSKNESRKTYQDIIDRINAVEISTERDWENCQNDFKYAYYNFDSKKHNKKGVYYSWQLAIGLSILCKDEWEQIINAHHTKNEFGKALKNKAGWRSSGVIGIYNSNESGLSLVPGGYIDVNGIMQDEDNCYLWTSTEDPNNPDNAFALKLSYNSNACEFVSLNKGCGLPVRIKL
jgi:uncharacterized protein (TIGR02145 family)